jgi:hypothetical protein
MKALVGINGNSFQINRWLGGERERERKRWDLKACKRAFGRFETLRTKKSIFFFFFFFFVYVCACNGLRTRSQGFFATSALSTLEDGPNVHILLSNLRSISYVILKENAIMQYTIYIWSIKVYVVSQKKHFKISL